MRVAILGLDGLEYELVKKFNMKNLMQKEYGITDLGDFDEIITPPIWASFLTGLPSEKHGIQEMYKWESNLLQKLSDTSVGMKWLKRITKSSKLKHLGFRKTYPLIRDKGVKTIFDYISRSFAINVPTYNRHLDRYLADLRRASLKNPRAFGERFEKCVYDKFFAEKNEFMKVFLEKDWTLLMGYTLMPDYLGHNYRGNLTKMWEAYAILDDFVGDVRSSAQDDVRILLISDHGMKLLGKTIYGDHSDYGFYSTSKVLGLNQPKITDFFDIILKELGCDAKA
ncbi:MAG: alkaline phosphatase family protein [Candidatus Bathyarchaeota archaeon]|nr:MAG: alkaline phosphatase family protein [Candidatus Bathyarchaeota archaeon]